MLDTYTVTDFRGLRCYQFNREPTLYPSVHAVLNRLPTAMTWVDDAARARGTMMHGLMAEHCKMLQRSHGRMWLSPDLVLHALCPQGYDPTPLFAVQAWLAEQPWDIIDIEQARICADYGYAGTPDALFRDRKTGSYIVLDWKFAETWSSQYDLQLEAYRHLDFKPIEPPIEHMGVQIKRNGHLSVHMPLVRPTEWAAFIRSAYELFQTINRSRLEGVNHGNQGQAAPTGR